MRVSISLAMSIALRFAFGRWVRYIEESPCSELQGKEAFTCPRFMSNEKLDRNPPISFISQNSIRISDIQRKDLCCDVKQRLLF